VRQPQIGTALVAQTQVVATAGTLGASPAIAALEYALLLLYGVEIDLFFRNHR
jgi:hypothetical protein